MTPEGDLSEMQRVLDSLGAPYGRIILECAGKRFPVFKMTTRLIICRARTAELRRHSNYKSIDAFTRLANGKGAELLTNQEARGHQDLKSHMRCTCRAGTYSARSLILAPSAWTNQVLQPFDIQLNLTIWQMTVAYFEAEVTKFALSTLVRVRQANCDT